MNCMMLLLGNRGHMKLRGDRNQCPTCSEYFNSTAAFEKHRTGLFSARRCLSIEEMDVKGMSKNDAGFWVTAKNPMFGIPMANDKHVEDSQFCGDISQSEGV